MSKSEDADASGSFIRAQYFYLLIAGVVAIVFGVTHPEHLVLGLVAGGVFVVVGGLLLARSFLRKYSGENGTATRF